MLHNARKALWSKEPDGESAARLSIQAGHVGDHKPYFWGVSVHGLWRASDLGSNGPRPAPEVVMRQGTWETATD